MTIMILHQLFLLSLASAQAPVVNLSYSSYEGSSLSNGVSQFLGLRYAAAPVGDLRFEAPQDPPFKRDTQKAKRVCSLEDYVEETPPC
jgi:Carboxylesterase type B